MASDNHDRHIASTLEGRDSIAESLIAQGLREKTTTGSKSDTLPIQVPLEQKLEIALKNNEFNKAIDILNLIKDQNRGHITSKYFPLTIEKDEKQIQEIRILQRNALQQISPDEERKNHSFYEGWAIMGLNFMSAAEILIKHYPFIPKKNKSQIDGMFLQFYAEFKHLVPAFIKWMQKKSDFTLQEKLGLFEHKLLRKLAIITGLSKEDIKNFLTLAREFSSYDHEYTAVMTQLSINIEPEYQKKWGKHIQVWRMMIPMVSHQKQDWLVSADPKKTALIKAYEDKMRSRPTPTQLRNTVVGPKNACDHRTYLVYDKKDGQQIEYINQFYTSGIPGHLLDNEDANGRATRDSLRQLKSLTGAKTLHTHSLVNRIGEEKNLDNQVANAAQDVGEVVHSNTPFQPYRYFSLNNLQGSNAILALTKNVKSETLQKLVNAYTRATSWKRFFISSYYSHNHNLHLASLTQQMVFHIYKAEIKNMKTAEEKLAIAKKLAHIVFCKSGKDRTGEAREAMDMYALLLTITDEVYGSDITIGAQAFQKQALEILKKFKESFHVGMHAGMAVGGTLGAFGILGDISSGKPDGWPSVVEQTAKYNKGLVKDPKKAIINGWVVGLIAVTGFLLTLSALGAFLGISFLAMAATATTSYLVSGTLLGSVAICTSLIGGGLLGKAFFKKYYHGNHHPPYIDKPDVPFYKSPRFWMVALITVASIGLCATGFGAILGGPLALFSIGASAAASGIITNASIVGLVLGLMTLVSGGFLHLKKNNQLKRYVNANNEFNGLVETVQIETAPKNEFPRVPTNLKVNTDLKACDDHDLVIKTSPTSQNTRRNSRSQSPPIAETPTAVQNSSTPTPVATPTSTTGTMFKSGIQAFAPNLQKVSEKSPTLSRTPSPSLSPKEEEEV